MADKKRKRQASETQSPNKKVAFDHSGDLQVTINDKRRLYPVLISSPGLRLPDVQFKGFTKPLPSKSLRDSKTIKPTTHDVILQSSDHPKLDYTAVPSTISPNISHYLGLFDPTTNKLEITPAHHLSLRSTLRSEAEEVEQEKRSFAQLRDELGREFGTKKMRKAIASRTDNAITQNITSQKKATDVQNAILEAVADSTVGTALKDPEAAAAALLASKPIPTPNLHAELVEDVYSIASLVPTADKHLVPAKEWQDKSRNAEDILFFHRFVAKRLTKIAHGTDTDKLVALGYLCLLLEFHDSLTGTRSKKVPKKEVLASRLQRWPPPLIDSVRRRFADESGTHLGKWQMDNLYTHICALSLFVDGWETDTMDLKADLKMETKPLTRYFSELACKITAITEAERKARNIHVAEASVNKMAKLKLPLEFPKARKGRR